MSHLPTTIFCWLPPDRLDAGAPRRAVLMRRSLDLPVGVLGLGAPIEREAPGQPVEDRQVEVEVDAEIEAQPLVAAAFGHQREPARDRIGLPADRDRLALPDDLAGCLRVAPEQRLHEFAAPGADQPVEPDDLAGPHRDAKCPRNPGP